MNKTSRILVTGANGHVGFNLARALHQKGYSVRATVRDRDDPAKTSRLNEAGLHDIVSLNIRDAETFEKVCQNIDILFHVAATYRHHVADAHAEDELIKDSTEGVRSAMEAAAANKISKVILTSSAVTLPFAKPGEPVPDETDWDPNPALAYRRAKIAGERLAWEMAKKHDIHLATILPTGIIGPDFGKGTQSTDMILAMMKGAMRFGTVDRIAAFVDIRDVVSAHILAAEKGVSGRFVVNASNPLSTPEFLSVMHSIDPAVPRPWFIIPKFAYGALPVFDWLLNRTMGFPRSMTREFVSGFKTGNMIASNQRTKDTLGWTDKIPLEQSLRDTMAELKQTPL